MTFLKLFDVMIFLVWSLNKNVLVVFPNALSCFLFDGFAYFCACTLFVVYRIIFHNFSSFRWFVLVTMSSSFCSVSNRHRGGLYVIFFPFHHYVHFDVAHNHSVVTSNVDLVDN